jgi:hypothetical protein
MIRKFLAGQSMLIVKSSDYLEKFKLSPRRVFDDISVHFNNISMESAQAQAAQSWEQIDFFHPGIITEKLSKQSGTDDDDLNMQLKSAISGLIDQADKVWDRKKINLLKTATDAWDVNKINNRTKPMAMFQPQQFESGKFKNLTKQSTDCFQTAAG